MKGLWEFIVDVLYQELKPTRKLLIKAARAADADMTALEACQFAEAILKALTHCRQKQKSMVTGAIGAACSPYKRRC